MSQLVTLPGQIANPIMAAFSLSNGTQAKVLQDVTSASGTLTGGARVYDLVASSTDASANVVIIWQALQMSLFAAMGSPNIATQNVINRTVGSYIADGFAVGDRIMVLGDTVTVANNGTAQILTGVTALVLTVNGTPFTNETCAAGFRIVKVSRRATVSIAANSGNVNGTSNVQLIGGNGNDSTKDALGISLGLNGLLLASMSVAVVGAVPAAVEITGNAMLY